MTVKSEPLVINRRFSINRAAGAATWLIGTFLTYLFLRTFQGDPLGILGAGAVAFISQLILTLAERPLWRFLLRRKGGRFVLASVAVTLIDAALNAAGLYPYMGKLSGTNVITMFAEVFEVSPVIDKRAALLLAGFMGLIVAGLAEFFWELDERK